MLAFSLFFYIKIWNNLLNLLCIWTHVKTWVFLIRTLPVLLCDFHIFRLNINLIKTATAHENQLVNVRILRFTVPYLCGFFISLFLNVSTLYLLKYEPIKAYQLYILYILCLCTDYLSLIHTSLTLPSWSLTVWQRLVSQGSLQHRPLAHTPWTRCLMMTTRQREEL